MSSKWKDKKFPINKKNSKFGVEQKYDTLENINDNCKEEQKENIIIRLRLSQFWFYMQ